MRTEGEGEEDRGAQCIMGNLLAVYAYSSITKGWLRAHLSFIKEESFRPTLKCGEGVSPQTQIGNWFHRRGA